MTRNEFIQRAIIAIASNPAFADEQACVLVPGAIIHEAINLADIAEERISFDEITEADDSHR